MDTILPVVAAVLVFAVVMALVYRQIARERGRDRRGILGHLSDGPNKGRVVVISLDGPATVLRLVASDDHWMTRDELGLDIASTDSEGSEDA